MLMVTSSQQRGASFKFVFSGPSEARIQETARDTSGRMTRRILEALGYLTQAPVVSIDLFPTLEGAILAVANKKQPKERIHLVIVSAVGQQNQ
jgi:hypothetical protein